jgi:pyridoxamine 5'-phosphate oxidase
MHDPIEVFLRVWSEAKRLGSMPHRNAVCISTIDADGYPNSRFVDLKQADERGFVFCTQLDSGKALDIDRNPKAGLTMWWEHVAMQIRIKGLCSAISQDEANRYWAARSRDAQIATATFQQSRPIASIESLAEQYDRASRATDGSDIPRPAQWGGFRLRPECVEFLAFKASRLHTRTAYTFVGERWEKQFLQP